jgi:hypothetical protein
MIDQLSPEHEALIPEFVERWKKIALSTDPIDQNRATAAINLLYTCAGLQPPQEIVFLPGPTAGVDMARQYGSGVSDALFGSHESPWISFYDYFQTCFGIVPTISGLAEVAKECGWVWAYDNLAIVTAKPLAIKFDDRDLLHCENGPAIEYADGTKIFSWHGTTVPAEWIEVGVTAQTAITWPNVEQRRAACEIVGWATIIKQLNGVVINQDVDPEIGTLLAVDIPDIGQEKFLRVRCGTKREFALPVPPTIKTALGAQAWMVGLDEEDFDKPEFRT